MVVTAVDDLRLALAVFLILFTLFLLLVPTPAHSYRNEYKRSDTTASNQFTSSMI